LVRPKVLILLPFRDSALRVVNLLIQLLSPQIGNRVMNHKRYLEEFGGNSFVFSQKHPKPEDFEQTFAGNTDDNFRLGISFTKKCMKLYSDYYNSDIIIASPLGLRLTIGAEGDEERDYDFLASIELLILDQTELFFMQNWDHLLHVFDHLHLQPQTTRNTGEIVNVTTHSSLQFTATLKFF
jgi:U3 small nucleolar RNA-associated protein 25